MFRETFVSKPHPASTPPTQITPADQRHHLRAEMIRLVLLALLSAMSAAQYDCALCPDSGSVCCGCCVGGVLTLAICNDAIHISGGCWPTSSASATLTASPSATFTPPVTMTNTGSPYSTSLPRLNNLVVWAAPRPCVFQFWTVPPAVYNVTVHLWGAGGSISEDGAPGGGGAYITGAMLTTPGETLRITVGAGGDPSTITFPYGSPDGWQIRMPAECGAADSGHCCWGGYIRPGGGRSAIERIVYISGEFLLLAVAAGGNGGVGSCGYPGIVNGTCGNSPGALAGSDGFGAGGGYCGGSGMMLPRFGSSSYTGGLTNAFGLETPIGNCQLSWMTPNMAHPLYPPGVGLGNSVLGGDGAVIIEWNGPNPSPTATSSATAPPSTSRSSTFSMTATASISTRASPSTTATATKSAFCALSSWSLHPRRDLDGSLVSTLLVPTEQACQSSCCDTTGCAGYAIDTTTLSTSSQTPCFMLANLTQLVPNNGMNTGIRIGPS